MEQQQVRETCEKTKIKLSSKTKAVVAAGTMCALLVAGTTAAYLTDNASITSRFMLNTDLKIELAEPHFIASSAEGLLPTQSVAKDPTITNTGTVPVYAMAQVKIPVFSGNVLNTAGTIDKAVDQDLYSFKLNSGWTQLGSPEVEGGYRSYNFVYDNVLNESEASTAVFDSVTVANLADPIATTDTKIDVNAYAIQSQGFDTAQDAWNGYVNQDAAVQASKS